MGERAYVFGRPLGDGRCGASRSRRYRLLAATCGALVVAGSLAACSSSNSDSTNPQGISDSKASELNAEQFAPEDAVAKTVLAPTPGSFLHGKTAVSTEGRPARAPLAASSRRPQTIPRQRTPWSRKWPGEGDPRRDRRCRGGEFL